jgi:hypothetical protein
MSFSAPEVCVADVVQWFRCANIRNEPIPAIVMRIKAPGVLELKVIATGGTAMVYNSRHIDDPQLVNGPQANRDGQGAWRLKAPWPPAAAAPKPGLPRKGERTMKEEGALSG